MNGKEKFCFLFLIVAIILSSLFSYRHNAKEKESGDTVISEIVDTIPYYKPVPKDSVVLRYVTIEDKKDNDNNIEDKKDNDNNIEDKKDNDNNIEDKKDNDNNADVIRIPITQKVYEDSLYRCYISGYACHLDSLILKYRQQQIITSITQPCPDKRKDRWSVGVQVGYGITINTTPQFRPYIGIGISYKLFEF